MPTWTTLDVQSTTRDVTDTFYGYNHQLKIGAGEFYETQNLTTDYAPMFANRGARGVVTTLENPQGMIEKDALAYVDDGKLYYNSAVTGLTSLDTSTEKQLIGMGAYICIFPDKMWYNTADGTYGSMEAHLSFTGTASSHLCTADGTAITYYSNEPENPQSGDYWLDASGDTLALKLYSSSEEEWTSVATVYTMITMSSVPDLTEYFAEYDGVTITSENLPESLTGSKILYAVSENSVIVIGLDANIEDAEMTITIDRDVPQMDYICECQNRLWGCYYGLSKDGLSTLNEIYCCALGDFKNWNQFLGLATDSYVASVGTDGQWTGAINYLGQPTFWKENHVHVVSVSSQGAHQIGDIPLRGVQKGSSKSLAIVNETLYYKGRTEICAWQGGFPTSVSANFGTERYTAAVAGSHGEKYYISMADKDGTYHLFVYDVSTGIWLHEDNFKALCFASVDDEIYAVNADTSELTALLGTTGTLETSVNWMAETGVLYYAYPDRKYLSRYNIRMKMAEDATASISIEYDSSGSWENVTTFSVSGTNTALIPIRPRRCDHMRIRLEGTGDVRIYSIAAIYESGSDVT